MAGKFVVSIRSDGKHGFALVAGNGQTILVSESYSSRATCLAGIESVRQNSQDAARFDRQVSSDGKPYFVLRATNGQVVGNSEMYSSESARDNGIASVTANAADAVVVESA